MTPLVTFVVPGRIDSLTGGYLYDRHIIAGLRSRGWRVSVIELDDSFPHPTSRARTDAESRLAGLEPGGVVVVDGLALGALPEEVERASRHHAIVALVHHPLALETGLSTEVAARLAQTEARALRFARRIVVTSRATAVQLERDGVAAERIDVVEPGTAAAPLAGGSGSGLSLITVATLIPRKGHDLLLHSLAELRDHPWTLVCVGSPDRDPATARRIRAQVEALGLTDRVTVTGELDADALEAAYGRADAFVLPTLYEGYGMAVAEAVARGLPVISTDTGAIRQMVGRAGLIVDPGDRAAFSRALHTFMTDQTLRNALRSEASDARDRLPTWDSSCRRFAAVLERVSAGASSFFDATWLLERERYDHRARARGLSMRVVAAAARDGSLRAVDLGAGTGSNLRYLSSMCAVEQDWLLVDHDDRLLAELEHRMTGMATKPHSVALRWHTLCQDLSQLESRMFAGRTLVTSSALLDLVSEAWLREVVLHCARAGAAVLFALNYTGRWTCQPEDDFDCVVRDLVNRHQRRDKGLGPALGPRAADRAATLLSAHGYQVEREASDWRIPAEAVSVQRMLIEGWARAACDVEGRRSEDVSAWQTRRLNALAAGRSLMAVSHEDVGGWLV
ncbi:MAG: glycosyltransferase family 4 protein [Vicinamibacterales bacterium]